MGRIRSIKKPLMLTVYQIRVGGFILALAIAIAVALVLAPKAEEIRVIANEPHWMMPALDSPITITFSRPVDRRSAERAFVIYPPVRGSFTWLDKQTMRFVPAAPMRANDTYRVIIQPGIRDLRGYQNRFETGWSIRTP